MNRDWLAQKLFVLALGLAPDPTNPVEVLHLQRFTEVNLLKIDRFAQGLEFEPARHRFHAYSEVVWVLKIVLRILHLGELLHNFGALVT